MPRFNSLSEIILPTWCGLPVSEQISICPEAPTIDSNVVLEWPEFSTLTQVGAEMNAKASAPGTRAFMQL